MKLKLSENLLTICSALLLLNCVGRATYDIHRDPNVYGRNRTARIVDSTHPEAQRAMVQLQQRCVDRTLREQHNVTRLDHVRAVLAPECTFRESSDDGLKLRLSCRSRMLFDAGNDQLKPSFEQQLPLTANCRLALENGSHISRMACVGEILASSADFAELRVGVVATVDRLPLLAAQLGCADVGGSFNTPVAQATWHSGESGMWAANDRLAYCRAARVASAIHRGITNVFASYRYMGPEVDPPLIPRVTIAALGASDAFYDRLRCPSTGDGDCSEARRVEVVLEIVPRVSTRRWQCEHRGSDPATLLYCLQSCEQVANTRVRSARQPLNIAPVTESVEPLPMENNCWHFASTNPGQTSFSARRLAESLGLSSSIEMPPCGTAAEFHRRQHHTSFQ